MICAPVRRMLASVEHTLETCSADMNLSQRVCSTGTGGPPGPSVARMCRRLPTRAQPRSGFGPGIVGRMLGIPENGSLGQSNDSCVYINNVNRWVLAVGRPAE